MPKRVSLAFELMEIQSVVDASRYLLESMEEQKFDPGGGAEEIPTLTSALLSLLSCRLHLLRRALEGGVDPLLLLAAHNLALPEAKELCLHPWSPAERAQHAEEDLRRSQAQQLSRPGRKTGR